MLQVTGLGACVGERKCKSIHQMQGSTANEVQVEKYLILDSYTSSRVPRAFHISTTTGPFSFSFSHPRLRNSIQLFSTPCHNSPTESCLAALENNLIVSYDTLYIAPRFPSRPNFTFQYGTSPLHQPVLIFICLRR